MQGPTTNRTSSADSYTISPSNTTAANTSYTLTYVNNFYQNAAYATTMVRAFDSYTSTDGGKTWSAPSGGATPVLPPASYATVPGGDVPLFKKGSTTTYATNVNDVLNGTSRNDAICGAVLKYADCSSAEFLNFVWLSRRKINAGVSAGWSNG